MEPQLSPCSGPPCSSRQGLAKRRSQAGEDGKQYKDAMPIRKAPGGPLSARKDIVHGHPRPPSPLLPVPVLPALELPHLVAVLRRRGGDPDEPPGAVLL